MHTEIAKVFWSGRSQAVRLPKDFRFDDSEVCIYKENGRTILMPKNKMTWQMFFENFAPCDDFVINRDNEAPQSRELF